MDTGERRGFTAAALTKAANGQTNGDHGMVNAIVDGRLELAGIDAGIARLQDALEKEGLDGVRGCLRCKEKERRKVQADLNLMEAVITSLLRGLLAPDELAVILAGLRQRREAEEDRGLRSGLRPVVGRVTWDDQAFELPSRPDATRWFGG